MDALAAVFVGVGSRFVFGSYFQRMKPLFLFITLLAASNLYAQDSVASQDFKAGPFTCSDMSGTYGKVLRCGYRNAEYKAIFDMQSILFRSHTQVVELTDDLREALKYVAEGNENQGTWNTPGVPVQVFAPWVGSICVWTDDGYITIRPKDKEVNAVIDGMLAASKSVFGE